MPSLKVAGCLADLVLNIERCLVIGCILHCSMAMGRLQMAKIKRLAGERPNDHGSRATIHTVLHEHRCGCVLGRDPSLLGVRWPHC